MLTFYLFIGFAIGFLVSYFFLKHKKASGKLIISDDGSKWIIDMDEPAEEIEKRRYVILKVYISH